MKEHKMVNFKQLKGSGNFYFIRHGQSTANIKKIIQGRLNCPLSDAGEKQAKQTGTWLKDKKIDTILTSPLDRAKTTAELIAAEAGCCAAEVIPNLIELDTGVFSGYSLKEAAEKFPEDYMNFHQYSWEGVRKAERKKHIYNRAVKHWEYLFLLFNSGKRNIVSVSHAGLIQWLIKASFGHREWFPLFPMTNCGVSQFAVRNIPVETLKETAFPNKSTGASGRADINILSSSENTEYTYRCEWKLINYHADQALK